MPPQNVYADFTVPLPKADTRSGPFQSSDIGHPARHYSIDRSIEEGTLDLIGPLNIRSLRKALRGISGVGTWTTEYVALRGLGDNDAFPSTDYALKRELKRHPEINLRAIQPWRGYAAITLWKRYVEAKTTAGSAAGLCL